MVDHLADLLDDSLVDSQVYFFIDCLVESLVYILVVSFMAVWLTQVEFLKDSLVDIFVDSG